MDDHNAYAIFVIWAKKKIREMKDKMTSHLSLLSSSTSYCVLHSQSVYVFYLKLFVDI